MISGSEQSPAPDDQPVLPQVTQDERDEGWGGRERDEERDASWYRDERPPHHE